VATLPYKTRPPLQLWSKAVRHAQVREDVEAILLRGATESLVAGP
jgi:hypothetical protein